MQPIKTIDKDTIIRGAVLRQLPFGPGINIEVSASAGAITLTGFVNGHAIKAIAEECAKGVSGVTSVANHIDAMPMTAQACLEG